jgi:hypothetical protein
MLQELSDRNFSTYNRIAGLLLSVDDARCEDCASSEGRSHSRDGALDKVNWCHFASMRGPSQRPSHSPAVTAVGRPCCAGDGRNGWA